MAINENHNLANKHVLCIADSGGGKTQLMADLMPAAVNKRVIIWDTHRAFAGQSFDDIHDLYQRMKELKDATSFTLRYTGRNDPAIFNMFCKMVWRFLDGRYITYMLVDEMADNSDAIGKDKSYLGECLRGGRKYGLIFYGSAVSAAEISKTAWRQCKIKYIGQQDDDNDIKRAIRVLMTTREAMLALKPLEFITKDKDKNTQRYSIKYTNPPLRT